MPHRRPFGSFHSDDRDCRQFTVRQCTIRPGELNKLRVYLDDFKRLKERHGRVTSDLDIVSKNVEAAQRVLSNVMLLYRSLASIPVVQNRFAWDWYDLQTSVSKSLSDVSQSVIAKRKEVASQASILTLRTSNLEANIASIADSECSIAGGWDGSWILCHPRHAYSYIAITL